MSLQEKEQEIVEEFEIFDDWLDKYSYIIDLGKELPPVDPAYKVNANLIDGCQSKVWLAYEKKDGRIFFYADSDAIISKGVISLLVKVFSGEKPEDILRSDFGFLKKIGLQEHLSPTRANGLAGMVQRIKEIAQQNIIA